MTQVKFAFIVDLSLISVYKMENTKAALYSRLYNSYVDTYSGSKSKKWCRDEANKTWLAIKASATAINDRITVVDKKIQELKFLSMKKKGSMLSFWPSLKTTSINQPISAKSTANNDLNSEAIQAEFELKESSQFPQLNDDGSLSDSNIPSSSSSTAHVAKSRVQDELKKKIAAVDGDLVGLFRRRESGMLSEDQEKDLNLKKKEREDLLKTLKRKQDDSERQKKSRIAKRIALEATMEKNPSLRSELKIRTQPGRPRIETKQPMLLETIINIAIHGSAAHEKRRSDVYRSVKTLDELTAALNQNGFNIKRGALYLRLLPKRSSNHEGLMASFPLKNGIY